MKFLSVLGLSAMLASTSLSAANSYGIPDGIQDGNILHCFDWTFADIQAELPNIAAAGFGAVQVSPVQGNCLNNAEWFYAYMPYDFKFKANGNGSRDQLKQLCEKAAEYGIKIVVDVVANHVNQASGYHDTWWDSNGRVRWYGGIKYDDRNSITHGQLGEYGDVNSEDSQVQARAKEFVQDLKSLGVKGIRWDAAKHIGLPSEGCGFWSTVCDNSGMWHYGEILDTPGGNGDALMKEYTKYMSVTDNGYCDGVRNAVNGGNVPSNYAGWAAGTIADNKVVYWAESHDDYSNEWQASTNISQAVIDRTWAIVACRNGASSLYFSRPAARTRNTIKMGQKGSTHFTSKEITSINKLHNAAVGHPDYFSSSNGVVSVTRKDVGAAIIRGNGQAGNVSVANGGGYCPAGSYKDLVSGNTFTVTASTISGNIGSTGIAVLIKDGAAPDPDPTPDPDPDPTPDPDKYYVYFNNTSNWNVKVWAWNDEGNCVANDKWPGDDMSTKNGKLYWEAPAGKVPTMIIFSNNGGDKAGGGDLQFVNGATYNPDGSYSVNDNPGPDPNPNPNMPAQLYVLGNVNDNNWNTAAGVAMTKDGNTFKLNDAVFAPAGTETLCYFNLSDALGADWDALNMAANRYGAAEEGLKITADSPAKMKAYLNNVDAMGCLSWAAPAGKFTLVADFSAMTVLLTTPAGVEVEAVDTDAEAVYYNLQGVRVYEPAQGVYIKVSGNKASKVYIY